MNGLVVLLVFVGVAVALAVSKQWKGLLLLVGVVVVYVGLGLAGKLPGPDAWKARNIEARIKAGVPKGATRAQVEAFLRGEGIAYEYIAPQHEFFKEMGARLISEEQGTPLDAIGGFTRSELSTRVNWGNGRRLEIYFVFGRDGRLRDYLLHTTLLSF